MAGEKRWFGRASPQAGDRDVEVRLAVVEENDRR
jgi:hypothetical protein